MCTSGLGNHCRNRTWWASRARRRLRREAGPAGPNLHEVPDGVRDEQAVFVEPLAAAFQIVRQVRFEAAQKVVVLGDGRLGSSRPRAAAACQRSLVGRHAAKLERPRSAIQTVLVDDFVRAADVVVDATGSPTGWNWPCGPSARAAPSCSRAPSPPSAG